LELEKSKELIKLKNEEMNQLLVISKALKEQLQFEIDRQGQAQHSSYTTSQQTASRPDLKAPVDHDPNPSSVQHTKPTHDAGNHIK
jgi:hypothetical protein